MKHLTTQNFINSAMIEDVLKQEGIPHFKKLISGTMPSVLVGQMGQTYEFYVEGEFFETAKEIVIDIAGELFNEDPLTKALRDAKEKGLNTRVFDTNTGRVHINREKIIWSFSFSKAVVFDFKDAVIKFDKRFILIILDDEFYEQIEIKIYNRKKNRQFIEGLMDGGM